MSTERHRLAVLLVPGDRVTIDGHRRQIKATRLDRCATGGSVAVITFQSGPSLRLPAATLVQVVAPVPASAVWFGDWSLREDVSGGPPTREVMCTTCHERYETGDDPAALTTWCVPHAGRTGHTGFRTTATGFLRAVVRPGPVR
ncbi:hypothetical protein [Streptomyces sp. AK02-01A]|uniref:DUF7848 domain-containing protein n=1 Tax=Streptomyces sp. AK02-01A TaxID=3028648 RepID=UPI0029BDEE5F|nr:hypothetical protein [Streptomyces sp. AK02-01A]MDX3855389.1 hypothetical protein [Streptomyces sp. AK02-01A]